MVWWLLFLPLFVGHTHCPCFAARVSRAAFLSQHASLLVSYKRRSVFSEHILHRKDCKSTAWSYFQQQLWSSLTWSASTSCPGTKSQRRHNPSFPTAWVYSRLLPNLILLQQKKLLLEISTAWANQVFHRLLLTKTCSTPADPQQHLVCNPGKVMRFGEAKS